MTGQLSYIRFANLIKCMDLNLRVGIFFKNLHSTNSNDQLSTQIYGRKVHWHIFSESTFKEFKLSSSLLGPMAKGKTQTFITFCVSSCVLNEFISSRGTLHPYLELSDYTELEGTDETKIKQGKEKLNEAQKHIHIIYFFIPQFG